MSTKAEYSEKPEAVTIVEDTTRVYVTLALNPVEKEREDEQGGTIKYWEADYTAFYRTIGSIDTDDVKENPGNYINFCNIDPGFQKYLSKSADVWMEKTAQSMDYDSITSAAKYIGGPIEKFAAEGKALRDWAANVYAAEYALLAKAENGEVTIPTSAEGFIAMLPQFSMSYANDEE